MSDDLPLDDLVREILGGGPAAREPDAWERLVTEAGGGDAWERAVERRRALSGHAHLVRGRPWLARLSHGVRRAVRRLGAMSHAPPTLELAQGPAGLALGPAEASPLAEALEVRWGDTRSVALPLGTTVTFRDPRLTVRYQTPTASGDLPTRTWTLEPGDAPVALVAHLGAGEDAPGAVVVLLEQK